MFANEKHKPPNYNVASEVNLFAGFATVKSNS
jgi:hypothetical protein